LALDGTPKPGPVANCDCGEAAAVSLLVLKRPANLGDEPHHQELCLRCFSELDLAATARRIRRILRAG